METGLTLHHQRLFSDTGGLLPQSEKELLDSRKNYSVRIQYQLPSHSGIIVAWNGDSIARVSAGKNMQKVFKGVIRELNGESSNHKFSFISAEHIKRPGKFRKLLKQQAIKSPLGEQFLEKFRSRSYEPHFFMSALTHVPFDFIVAWDHEREMVQFGEMGIPPEAHCIYFVREHGPEFPLIVYAGKSFGRSMDTIKDHYRTWNGKGFCKGVALERAEDRGNWMDKLKDGYHYEIGILVLPQSYTPTDIFEREVKLIERCFIKLLDPRDNDQEKLTDQEKQRSLFQPEDPEETPF